MGQRKHKLRIVDYEFLMRLDELYLRVLLLCLFITLERNHLIGRSKIKLFMVDLEVYVLKLLFTIAGFKWFVMMFMEITYTDYDFIITRIICW